MKKIFLVTQSKDVIGALEALRNIGILHVEHDKAPVGPVLESLKSQIQLLDKAIDVLDASSGRPSVTEEQSNNWQETAQEILNLAEEDNRLTDEIAKRQLQIDFWKPWGYFDLQDVKDLARYGIYAYLCEASPAELQKIPSDMITLVVSQTSKLTRLFVLMKENSKLPCQQVIVVPAVGLAKIESLQNKDKERKGAIKKKLEYLSGYGNIFKKILEEKKAELTFQEVLTGMGESEKLMYLKGFCPVDKAGVLEAVARKQQWGLLIENPDSDDTVPTLLRNPKWIEVIKPVFSMMNILPGYRELDISLFFLIFFSVFFGMLVGDVGYGSMFFLLTVFGHVKLGSKLQNKSVFFLMYLLSVCAIVWGVLTGVYFGQAWLANAPLKPLLPWLNESRNIQMLCFLIGAIHLTIAHIWRAVNKMPALGALSELGWIALLWASFFLARLLILGEALPSFANALFISGPVFVILFSQPDKNILKAVGGGLGNLLLSLVNMFTDVVSYIRLFAVGLATVAVADAFNQMAGDIGMNSVLSGIVMALILIGGHVLNFVLCAMAILVHGIRLNVLEFSSHLNMEWTGVVYDPLRGTKDIKA